MNVLKLVAFATLLISSHGLSTIPCMTEGEKVAYPIDTTKYIICVEDTFILEQCDVGMRFNATTTRCERINGSTNRIARKNLLTDTFTEEPDDTENSLIISTTLLPNDDYICPFFGLKFLPHASNCSKFICCVLGAAIEMTCKQGKHFNPNFKMCDNPKFAGCFNYLTSTSDSAIQTNTVTNTPYTIPKNLFPYTTILPLNFVPIQRKNSTRKEINLENNCSLDNSTPYMAPHPTDCTKFIYCVKGKEIYMSCPEGKHFNPTLNFCDTPQRAECDLNLASTTEVISTTPISISSVTLFPKILSITSDNPQNVSHKTTEKQVGNQFISMICPFDAENPTIIPYPNNCSNFIYCVMGKQMPMQCPEGKHFNPFKKICDDPENAGCDLSLTSSSTKSTDTFDIESNTISSTLSTPEYFDLNMLSTTTLVEEHSEHNICIQDTETTYMIPHPSDCSKFIYCVMGKAVPMSCPDESTFNSDLQECDMSENARCAVSPILNPTPRTRELSLEKSRLSNGISTTFIPAAESSTLNILTSSTNQNELPSESISELSDGSGITFIPAAESSTLNIPTTTNENGFDKGTEYICSPDIQTTILLPDPDNCEKFIYCAMGTPISMSCPGDTEYNSILKICDKPENADCNRRPSYSNENAHFASTIITDSNFYSTTFATPNTFSIASGIATSKPFTHILTSRVSNFKNTTPNIISTTIIETDNICSTDATASYVEPHPTDCSKYFYCKMGKQLEFTCAKGTLFNAKLKICDKPKNVKCNINLRDTPDESKEDLEALINSLSYDKSSASDESITEGLNLLTTKVNVLPQKTFTTESQLNSTTDSSEELLESEKESKEILTEPSKEIPDKQFDDSFITTEVGKNEKSTTEVSVIQISCDESDEDCKSSVSNEYETNSKELNKSLEDESPSLTNELCLDPIHLKKPLSKSKIAYLKKLLADIEAKNDV